MRKSEGEKGRSSFTHNGTAIAISRAIIAVAENYQQADGSITVPEVLRRWMGKDRIDTARLAAVREIPVLRRVP